MEIKKVDLNDITFSEIALRKHKENAEHILELAIDIEKRGLLNLPTLVSTTDGFIVTDGARRVSALKYLLQEGKIEAIQTFQIKEPQDDLETLADMIAGNVNIRKTANKEYIQALYRLATESDVSLSQLSKTVGMSEEYIMRLFKTLRLPENILELAEAEKISVSNLISMSDLAGKLTEEELEEWVDKAKEETAKDFALSIAKEVDVIRETAKSERKESQFVVTPKLRTKEELDMLLIQCKTAFEKNANPKSEARYQLMREIWQVDEVSVAAAKKLWEEKQAEKEKKKEERKESREKIKLEDMKELLEKDGYKISKNK